MTGCPTGCKEMGASFFLSGLGSLRLLQNFLEAQLTIHDWFKWPLGGPS